MFASRVTVARTILMTIASMLATLSLTLAQEPPAGAATKAQQKKAAAPQKEKGQQAKGGLRAGGGAPPKGLDMGAVASDPLLRSLFQGRGLNVPQGQVALPPTLPDWPYHFTMKITGRDGIALSAQYYPSRARENAPVVLLVHQTGTGHGLKDFSEPIEGLEKPRGLAEYLQGEDFAVMTLDLRGHGGSGLKQELVARDWISLASDLRTAYLFLVDRHNRQELNLAKLGVIGVGDGGSLAAAWAVSDNGPISSPGRVSDLAALVIISPVAEANSLRLAPALNQLAPRAPVMLIAGERDTEVAQAAQKTVERNRLGKVAFLETRLQGDVLIRLEPKVAETLLKFLEEPVKFRGNAPWVPRYLMTPDALSNVSIPDAAAKAKAKTKEEPAKTKEEPAGKAEDKKQAPAPAAVKEDQG